ncbi:hypothetical protein HMPREF1991_00610 [Hoylesella loescheii DSM 19665 = JCM 12249 = ATCC 15930]|uniref:Uncharacterized protein n=1 Tax=Hoylesella loescheii DSM 19665 = JCM 12249 = ATCC 15930 TaxID=1122985 RepID=A0A069QTR5_HOYLO|nr:hypothetical protein HMPREF1991_00610 [Hoylesella loescheii DSM 19665 = JCM 12249 = ATCC 15930]
MKRRKSKKVKGCRLYFISLFFLSSYNIFTFSIFHFCFPALPKDQPLRCS